jgi:hypothetical protein
VLLAVFLTGLWMGRGIEPAVPEPEVYIQLAQQQDEWIDRVENLYRQSLAAQRDEHPFWLQRFKVTADWLNETYRQNPDDLNVRQAVNLALYQNLLVLQALYQSMSANPNFMTAQFETDTVPTPAADL